MNRHPSFAGIAVAAAVFLTSAVHAQSPFVDIPPCHWAADAVTEIAGKPDVEPDAARGSRYLAENAVQQVFEGLKCNEPKWSRAFMASVPDGWEPHGTTGNFSLELAELELAGERGTVEAAVTVTVDGSVVERSGMLELVFEDGRWKVEYAGLAALDLSLFP